MRTERDLPTVATVLGLGAWFWATALSCHPSRDFDRFRALDHLGAVLPDWRFFAPNPAEHDYHVIYRVGLDDGGASDWVAIPTIPARTWTHMVWAPDKRRAKGVFDACSNLVFFVGKMSLRDLRRTSSYEVLSRMVATEVRAAWPAARGYQFAMVKDAGFEDGHSEYLIVSAYERV